MEEFRGARAALVHGSPVRHPNRRCGTSRIDAGCVGALHGALQAGLDAICRLGKAKVGDKTMIDTLDPFVKAFGEAATQGLTIPRPELTSS